MLPIAPQDWSKSVGMPAPRRRFLLPFPRADKGLMLPRGEIIINCSEETDNPL